MSKLTKKEKLKFAFYFSFFLVIGMCIYGYVMYDRYVENGEIIILHLGEEMIREDIRVVDEIHQKGPVAILQKESLIGNGYAYFRGKDIGIQGVLAMEQQVPAKIASPTPHNLLFIVVW